MVRRWLWGKKLDNLPSPDSIPSDNTTPNNGVGALALTAIGSALLVWLGLCVGSMMGGVVFGLFFGMMLSHLILIMAKAQKAVWALVWLMSVIANIVALIILSKFIDLRHDWQTLALVIIDMLIYTLTALVLFDFCGFKNLWAKIGISTFFLLLFGLPSLFGMMAFIAFFDLTV